MDVIIHMGSLVPAAAISEASAWLSQHESECLQTDGRSWDQVVAHAVDLLRQPAREAWTQRDAVSVMSRASNLMIGTVDAHAAAAMGVRSRYRRSRVTTERSCALALKLARAVAHEYETLLCDPARVQRPGAPNPHHKSSSATATTAAFVGGSGSADDLAAIAPQPQFRQWGRFGVLALAIPGLEGDDTNEKSPLGAASWKAGPCLCFTYD